MEVLVPQRFQAKCVVVAELRQIRGAINALSCPNLTVLTLSKELPHSAGVPSLAGSLDVACGYRTLWKRKVTIGAYLSA